MSLEVDIAALLSGQRRALAKAITLVESQRESHQQAAQSLVTQILPYTGKSFRIGLSGAPGVGKSTFIEALGLYLIEQGKRVAVLAVDPSSPVSGGSILGDKTRMEQLARHPSAYIRPSPAGGQKGGVAQATREAIFLCESAGYDIILVETVGVGQSEYDVASMADFFLVLLQPNTGDELQGIKKGIIELADALVINKADGDNTIAAKKAKQQYRNALTLLSSKKMWQPTVQTCSALFNDGINEVWSMLSSFENQARASGFLAQQRQQQNSLWMEQRLHQLIMQKLETEPEFIEKKRCASERVKRGEQSSVQAAQELSEIINFYMKER